MDQRTLLGRLLSPAGFAIVLIFFLLPFATVSCGDGKNAVDATFTGVNMAVGTVPSVVTQDTDPDTGAELGQLISDEIDLEPLALLSALAVFAGIVVGVVRRRKIRFGVSAGLAVVAAVLVVGAISRVPGHVTEFIQKVGGAEGLPAGFTTATHTRYGFWLAVVTLVGLAGGNGFALIRTRGADDRPPPPPEHADVYLPLDELTYREHLDGREQFEDHVLEGDVFEDDVLEDELTEQERAGYDGPGADAEDDPRGYDRQAYERPVAVSAEER